MGRAELKVVDQSRRQCVLALPRQDCGRAMAPNTAHSCQARNGGSAPQTFTMTPQGAVPACSGPGTISKSPRYCSAVDLQVEEVFPICSRVIGRD